MDLTLGLALSILGAVICIVGGGAGSMAGTLQIAKAGAGLVAEDPKYFGQVLLMAALPNTQGVYGFLGAILILQQTGLLAGEINPVSTATGLGFIFAALPVALACYISGNAQGKLLLSGLKIVAKDAKEAGKAIILGVLIESDAVFGLLVTILMVNNIKVGA